MKRHIFIKHVSSFIFCSTVLFLAFVLLLSIFNFRLSVSFAEIMSSGSYKIQSDSVNFAGNRSTSTTYSMEDTVGEIATGDSESTLFKIKAGYQQMQETYLAMTAAGDVSMSPSIGGISGGTSNGSTNFTVTTDNAAGYSVTIKASSTPALQSPLDSFTDYSATAASPDFNFSVPATASNFAFTPEGTDIAGTFKDNGGACAVGSSDTADKCWAGLSTSQQTIVTRTSSNQPGGTLTTIKFKAESGSSHVQVNGTYTATTTITAFSL